MYVDKTKHNLAVIRKVQVVQIGELSTLTFLLVHLKELI
jgi:hypothetical protein